MKRTLAFLCCFVLIMMCCGPAGAEKMRIAEEVEIPADPGPCPVYWARTADLAALPAGLFPQDGNLWTIESFHLEWEGPDAREYHQLLQYIHDHDLPLEWEDLSFMTAEDAAAAGREWLAGMGFDSLEVARVYALTQDRLRADTDAMKKEYAGMKAPALQEITAEKETCCVIFRGSFGSMTTVGDGAPFPAEYAAQGMIILRADGPVYIALDSVPEKVTAGEAASVLGFSRAYAIFAESRQDFLGAEAEYTVTNVSFGYQASGRIDGELGAEYAPFWQIGYTRTLAFDGNRVTTRHETLISALTGEIRETR